jgi:hypothetical protein
MATQQIHKSKRHANPMLTRNGRPRYKAFTIKQLEEALAKAEPKGKKRAKIMQELNRKTNGYSSQKI